MTKLKYFDGIREAQKNQRPLSEMPPFDLGRIRKTGLLARIAEFIVEDHPRVWLAFLRRFRPTGKLFGVLLVTKNADVRDILERGDEFQTPYGPEMTEFARGSNFILGMQDGADYRRMKSSVLSAFPPAEVEAVVRPIAARHSQEIMMRASPGFDAISGLLKLVPVHICRDYFGLEIERRHFRQRALVFLGFTNAVEILQFGHARSSPPAVHVIAMPALQRLGLHRLYVCEFFHS